MSSKQVDQQHRLRITQLANRINLHLALGGSFDSSPATTLPAATATKQP
jgi:hypothetical protein